MIFHACDGLAALLCKEMMAYDVVDKGIHEFEAFFSPVFEGKLHKSAADVLSPVCTVDPDHLHVYDLSFLLQGCLDGVVKLRDQAIFNGGDHFFRAVTA